METKKQKLSSGYSENFLPPTHKEIKFVILFGFRRKLTPKVI